MIEATDSVRVYRHPGADRESESPLEEGRTRYLRPLVTDGTAQEPDQVDLRERLPLEFAGDDDEQASKREDQLEADLIETFDAFEELDEEDE